MFCSLWRVSIKVTGRNDFLMFYKLFLLLCTEWHPTYILASVTSKTSILYIPLRAFGEWKCFYKKPQKRVICRKTFPKTYYIFFIKAVKSNKAVLRYFDNVFKIWRYSSLYTYHIRQTRKSIFQKCLSFNSYKCNRSNLLQQRKNVELWKHFFCW